jgi:hypothetical protein
VRRVALLVTALLLAGCGGEDRLEIVEPVVGRDGRSMAVGIGSCLDGTVEAEETDAEVRLTARGNRDGGDCGWNPVRILLDEPLGTRVVIDTLRDEPERVVSCRGRTRQQFAVICDALDDPDAAIYE